MGRCARLQATPAVTRGQAGSLGLAGEGAHVSTWSAPERPRVFRHAGRLARRASSNRSVFSARSADRRTPTLIRMTLSKTAPTTRTRAEHLRPDRRCPQVLDIALEIADEQGIAVSRSEWGRTARRPGGPRAEVGGDSIVAADPAPVLTAAVARGRAQIADRFAYPALPGYL